MIRINLLPDEYRRVERTSIALFLVFMVLVVAACLSAVFMGYTMIQNAKLERRKRDASAQVQRLQAEVADIDEKRREMQEFGKRHRVIMTIRANRIYWSRKLDELASVMQKNGLEDAWLVGLKMEQKDPAPDPQAFQGMLDGGYLLLKGFHRISPRAGGRAKPGLLLSTLREKLRLNRSFFADFTRFRPPDFQVVDAGPDAPPQDRKVLEFEAVIYLKPRLEFQPVEQ